MTAPWWRDAVIYQIYPRSFQDSDGDGVGDLRGIASRLDHLVDLGVDAFWLSPIYPSPLADCGYDISNYVDVDPRLGTLADFDDLTAAAHERGLRVLLDLVPCHTSIEHPWFRERPDYYVWSPVDGPANNWMSAFGGGAWSRDERTGRWYLHSFYPEQPDLDWHNPQVVEAMEEVVRFWVGRGADGFRVDAIDRLVKDKLLRDDPPATNGPPLPVHPDSEKLDRIYSANRPEAIEALGRLRAAAGDAMLVGEVYQPTHKLGPYLRPLDLAFAFELVFSPWDAGRLRTAIAPAAELGRVAWVMSNHDSGWLASRVGEENVRAAATLLLTLPGVSFVYQGDELGATNGPGAEPPHDRAGRDGFRSPMRWDASPTGGFSDGEPWLAPLGPPGRNVEAQRDGADSPLGLYRRLIALRRTLGAGFRLLDASPGVVAYERGGHVVAINPGSETQPAPPLGEVLLATHPGALEGGRLAPHAAIVAARA